MQEETPEKDQKKIKRKRIAIRGLWIGIALSSLLSFILLVFGAEMLRNLIIKTVDLRSGGLYSVEMEELDLKLLQLGFDVKGFYLIPNKELYNEKKSQGLVKTGLYEIKIPEFRLRGFKFSLAYYQNIFTINEMFIGNPQIKLIDIPLFSKKDEYEEGYDDIKPIVVRLMEELRVKDLKLEDGVFDIFLERGGQSRNFTASKISIELSNFQIDRKNAQGNEKFLYSDHAKILFKDYQITLNDGIHVIEANEIGLDTRDSVIFAHGFSLKPSQISKDSLLQSKKSHFSAFFPEIKLTETDIIKAYERDTFDIGSMLILKPKIKFYNLQRGEGQRKSSKPEYKFDLYPLIDGYFKKVEVLEFKISKGNFQYREPLEHFPENILISGIDVNLIDFMVDSTAFQHPHKILYSNDLEFDFSKFSMTLRDSVHKLEAQSLIMSSKDKVLDAKGFSIHPIESPNLKSTKDRLRLDIDDIKLEDFDLFKMYITGDLRASILELSKPYMKLENKGADKEIQIDVESAIVEGEENQKNNVYKLFSKYLKSAKFDEVYLHDGAIDYIQKIAGRNEEILADQISIVLYNFNFDSTRLYQGDQILYSENIDFELRDYDFILPNELNEITVGKFKVSSIDKFIALDDITMRVRERKNIKEKLSNKGKAGYLEFHIPQIRIENAGILKALNRNNASFGRINIHQPQLTNYKYKSLRANPVLPPEIEDLKNLITEIIPTLSIEELNLISGKLKHVNVAGQTEKLNFQNNFHVRTKNFLVSKEEPLRQGEEFLFTDTFQVVFENQELFLNDKVHKVHADSTILSYPEKKLEFYGFNITPDTLFLDSLKSPIYYTISSSYAAFDSLDLQKFYDEQILEIDKLKLDGMDLSIYSNPKKYEEDTIQKAEFEMPKILKELSLKEFEVQNGKWQYLDDQKNKIAYGTISGRIANSFLNQSLFNKKQLPFDDFHFVFPEFKLSLPNTDLSVSIDSLSINMNEQIIKSEKLSLENGTDEKGISVLLDSFEISGVDVREFHLLQELRLDRMKIWHPFIRFYADGNDENAQRPDIFNLNFYPSIKNFLSAFQLNKLEVADGHLMGLSNSSSDTTFNLEHAYLDAEDVLIDSSSHLDKGRWFYSKNIEFKLKDFSRTTADGMNSLNFEEIGLRAGKSQLFVKNFELEPLYDEFEYSRKLGYQSDRIEAKISNILINNIDFKKLYNEEIFKCGSISLDTLYLKDFRDKRVPARIGFRPPMPHYLIRSIPITFYVDSVFLNNGEAYYREFVPEGEEAGEVFFSDINSKIYMLSNDPLYYPLKPTTYLFALAKLMGEGDIIMSGTFNLLDLSNSFAIRGSLGKMDMTKVNPMLEPVAFVTIKSGIAKYINFDFEADEDYARGSLKFGYQKFKIFVLNKKTGEPEGLDEGLVSWMANTFLINSRNPHFGFFKEGEIFFRRDKSKSIVNYVWKSLFSGIKTSIGAQTQKKLHKIAEKEEKASRGN